MISYLTQLKIAVGTCNDKLLMQLKIAVGARNDKLSNAPNNVPGYNIPQRVIHI